jgi:hypothetical protein
MVEQLDLGQGAEDVVTLGVRWCRLLWVGSAGGSRRALRTHSPRILFRCPVLRRQILGVCRRDMGAESRGHRRRDRSGAALSQKRACPSRAGRSLESAVMRPSPLLVRMHPDVRRDIALPRQPHHVHGRLVPPRSARPAFQRRLKLPDRRVARTADSSRLARVLQRRHLTSSQPHSRRP